MQALDQVLAQALLVALDLRSSSSNALQTYGYHVAGLVSQESVGARGPCAMRGGVLG